MKKIVYLLMSLSFVAFASCEDKENSSSESRTGIENGYEWVDLGLPSGTLWATCNVGASKPYEYGNNYAWGEVTTKETYDWSTYKYGSDYDRLTKYCSKASFGKDGFTDNKTILDPEDDAAYVNWGGKWRMPTNEQMYELGHECYWEWTANYNGTNVAGFIVYKFKNEKEKMNWMIGKLPSRTLSDPHIFLPASPCVSIYGELHYADIYWSSTLVEQYPECAYYIYINSSAKSDGIGLDEPDDHVLCWVSRYENSRCDGYRVRAVIPGKK